MTDQNIRNHSDFSSQQPESKHNKPRQRKEKQAKSYPHYQKREQEHQRYWKELRRKLKELQDEKQFSATEIAEGLGISRQTYAEFINYDENKDKDKGKTLPIYRDSLLALWDFLTAPQQIEDKRHLSPENRAKRQSLKNESPDRLLEIVGFLPESQSLALDGDPLRQKKIHRIASRLCSSWIQDKDLWKMEEIILNTIIEEGRFNNENFEKQKDQRDPTKFDLKTAEKWIERLYKDSFNYEIIKNKFLSSINRYNTLGKSSFDLIELFELYQSIAENEFLRDQNKKEKNIRIRIVDCEFRSLNESFKDMRDLAEDNPDHSNILWKVIDIGIDTENQLRRVELKKESKNEGNENIFLAFQPVKEAKITYRLGEDKKYLSCVYHSSSAQVENMLIALKEGLGYTLELTGLSMRALGNESSSLARVSAVLYDKNSQKNYQGLWVDINTLNCMLQAVALAVESWLSEKIHSQDNYYSICQCTGKILNDLQNSRKALYDYRIENNNYSKSAEQLADEVLEETKKLNNYLLEEDESIRNFYQNLLERIEHMAKLVKARSAHIEGNIISTKKLLYTEANQSNIADKYNYIPVYLLYATENMIYKLFAGERQFLVGELWRVGNNLTLASYTNQIKEYIENNSTALDINLYLSLSEIYGNFGRLELYSCKNSERKQLEMAVNNFLIATYFSLKIDRRQRVAHWLTHLSRTSSRLGDKDKAEQYASLAKQMVTQAISPRDNSKYCEAIMAEVNLADGEKYLLIDNNPYLAIEAFLKALNGSLNLKFARLIADSLYGIARSAKLLSEKEVKKGSKFHFKINFPKDFSNSRNTNGEQTITEKVTNVLTEIEQNSDKYDNEDDYWKFIYNEFKAQAKKIWHDWANVDINSDNQPVEHPFEGEIDTGNFLGAVD